MPNSTAQTKDEMSSDQPLARIDSQDDSTREIVRKFLESHGCDTTQSRDVSRRLTYHIIIGDTSFVKSILAHTTHTSSQPFLIVRNATPDDVNFFLSTYHTKIWLTSILPVDPKETDVLFAFFFAGAGNVHGNTSTKIEERILPKELITTKKPPPSIEEEWEKRRHSVGVLLKKETAPSVSVPHPTKSVGFMERLRGQRDIHVDHAKKKHSSFLHHGIRSLIYIIFLLMFWYGLSFGIASGFLVLGSRALIEGNGKLGGRFAHVATYFINQNQLSTTMLSAGFELIGQEHIFRGGERVLSFMDTIAESEKAASELIDDGRQVAVLLLAKDSTSDNSPALAMERMRQRVGHVQTLVNLADAEARVLLDEKPFPLSVPFIASSLNKRKEQLVRAREALASAHKLLELYPTISGFKEKKTYLLLLQNSAELRPTGGFIGSIAIASFEEGKLQDLSVQDVYTVDGQLKGHIDPPLPIRELMSQEHWYLRDSNWDPDFSVSGPRAMWFYEKETGNIVDGVIAINSPFIVEVLRATGPMQLPDYNDTITADNFYAKSLYYTHTDFFPGSTQKKDFLGSLLTALVTRITTTNDTLSIPTLFKSVSNALDRGDVMFSFADSQTQELVGHFGWGGTRSFDQACIDRGNACLADGVSIVDANIGVNKVNYFITKKQEQHVVIGDDGMITAEASSSYHNSSASDDPAVGGGVYKNYARWYLPADATVSAIMNGGVNIPIRDPTNTKIPSLPFAEIDSSQPGWLIVGIAFTVAPTEDRRISVSYARKSKLPLSESNASYRFTSIMQPGITQSQFSLTLSYPLLWTVHPDKVNGDTSIVVKEGKVQYNSQVPKTQTIHIGFTK